jgi:hypothetical protein
MLTTATMPKSAPMSEKQVVESTIELSSAGSTAIYNITAQDQNGSTLPGGSTAIVVPFAGKLWGSNNWGDGSLWTSNLNIVATYLIPWTMPLVFSKMQLQIAVSASSAIAIGTAFFRYQNLGYTNSG